MKRIWIPQVIISAMLLWALKTDNSYGYYILLRWVCCAVLVFLTIQAVSLKDRNFSWILGVTAVIYNPFAPLHLTREIWSVINVATIVVAIASIFILKVGYKRKEPPNKTDSSEGE